MDILELIILILATWRLSSLLVQEDGPKGILKTFRDWTFNYTQLFECLWCTSIWIAVFIFIVYQTIPVVCVILAISAGAILVDRFSQ